MVEPVVTAGLAGILAVVFIASISLLGTIGLNYANGQNVSAMLSQSLEAKAGERALESLDEDDDE